MDPREKELKEKVTALVGRTFGGDWDRAFRHYARMGGDSGLVDDDAVSAMLKDAGIGNAFTRGAWTSGVIEKLDTDKDDAISLTEFRTVFQN